MTIFLTRRGVRKIRTFSLPGAERGPRSRHRLPRDRERSSWSPSTRLWATLIINPPSVICLSLRYRLNLLTNFDSDLFMLIRSSRPRLYGKFMAKTDQQRQISMMPLFYPTVAPFLTSSAPRNKDFSFQKSLVAVVLFYFSKDDASRRLSADYPYPSPRERGQNYRHVAADDPSTSGSSRCICTDT